MTHDCVFAVAPTTLNFHLSSALDFVHLIKVVGHIQIFVFDEHAAPQYIISALPLTTYRDGAGGILSFKMIMFHQRQMVKHELGQRTALFRALASEDGLRRSVGGGEDKIKSTHPVAGPL